MCWSNMPKPKENRSTRSYALFAEGAQDRGWADLKFPGNGVGR